MDVVDPVEVGLEDIVRPAAAASQGVTALAFSHNQVENWGRLASFSVYKYSAINKNIKQDLLAYDPLFFVGEPCAKDRPHGSSVT